MSNRLARRAGAVSLLTITLAVPLAGTGASASESRPADLPALKPQYALASGLVLQDFWCWTSEIAEGFSKGALIGFLASIETGGVPGAVLGGAGGMLNGASEARDKC